MNAPSFWAALGVTPDLPRSPIIVLLRRLLSSANWPLTSAFRLGTTGCLGFPAARLPSEPPSLKSNFLSVGPVKQSSKDIALRQWPRLERFYNNHGKTAKAVIKALAAVAFVPSIEAEDVAIALTNREARYKFLKEHHEPQRSKAFNCVAWLVRDMGLFIIAGSMNLAAPIWRQMGEAGKHRCSQAFQHTNRLC